MESSRFNADMLQEPFEQGEFSSGVVITFQVMAVARVSPGDPDAVGALTQCGKDEFGAHPAAAGYPDNPEIGRVLETAYPGQVRCAITAPVAEECRNLWLPVIHKCLPSLFR